jgi:hypothetical protein
MPEDPLPHQQRIGEVSTRGGSQAFVGNFNDCHINIEDSRGALRGVLSSD